MSRTLGPLLLLGFLLLAAPAWALSIQLAVDGGPAAELVGDGVLSDPGNGYEYWLLDDPAVIDGVRVNSWTAQLADDWLSSNLSVTNESGSTRTVSAQVTLPLGTTLAYASVLGSSFGVAFTDSNADGGFALGPDGSTPLFQGLVDTGAVLGLDLPGGSLGLADCAPFPFAGCSGSAATSVAGAVGAGLGDALGIALLFHLSPGDSVAFTSRFAVAPAAEPQDIATPEPGTGGLLALGLLGLALGSHRRAR